MHNKLLDKLKRILFCLNPEDLDIEGAMRLKHKDIPTRLFKYRSCEVNVKPDRVFAFENFRDDTAWFASPDSFNDPYDTSCCFEYGEEFLSKILADSMRSHNEGY